MRIIVQFTVLCATLFLLTGGAFAQCWDICYEFKVTDQDDGHTHTGPTLLTFCNDNTGKIIGPFGTDMSLFFDVRKRALAWDDEGCVGSLEFHGGLNGVTGIGFCEGERHEIRGHKIEEENCPLPTLSEGEPCGSDTNGGCNMTVPAYGSIACGQTVTGTAWADLGTRDTDWYVIDLPDTGGNGQEVVTATLVSDFEGAVFIVSGAPGPCSPSVLDTGCSNDGVSIETASATLTAPGTYVIFVATGSCEGGGIFEGYPCNGDNNYTVTVDCSDVD